MAPQHQPRGRKSREPRKGLSNLTHLFFLISTCLRFDFLLKQTELFSHFMGQGKNKSPVKAKTSAKSTVKKGKEGDNRSLTIHKIPTPTSLIASTLYREHTEYDYSFQASNDRAGGG